MRSILNWVTGVKEVKVNSSNETATVTYDEQKTGLNEIRTALKKGGYPVQGEQDFVERE
ncbi:MAG: cation transporter [Desulfohalobiaceae bacterium]|nr:cation transporter [Desulfohalobiaceae bacterium]